MKKDIIIPESINVHMALVPEVNKKAKSTVWYAYLLNQGKMPLETVLIVSEGQDDYRKTSKMRRTLSVLPANSYAKVELVQEEVLSLNNQFNVTYFIDNKLFEKVFRFDKNSTASHKLTKIPLLERDGIFVK
jgi:hypothetical protein